MMVPSSCQYARAAPLEPSRRGDGSLKANEWTAFRDHLRALGAEDAADALIHCERVLIFSRHHWLKYRDQMYDRQGLSGAFASVAEITPQDWTEEHGELAFLLFVLGLANLGLEQVDGVLSTEHVARLVSAREDLYSSELTSELAIGEPGQAHRTLTEAAYRLRDLRYEAEKTAYRYSIIDGARWHLTEGLLRRSDVESEDVPIELLHRLGVDGSGTSALREAALSYIAKDGYSERAVIAIMRFALEDDALGVDHVTITGPKQVGLPPSECLGERDNIYRRTELRRDVELKDFESQLGHDSPERLTRVIGARMQVLKLKSAKQFFGSGCLGGEGSEKFGDYMIYANEDSHYLGHRNGGISTGGRAPIPLTFERDGAQIDLPGIFGDFRAVRLSHAEVDRFDVAGLSRVIQFAAWLGSILNTTYEVGAAITPAVAVKGGTPRMPIPTAT